MRFGVLLEKPKISVKRPNQLISFNEPELSYLMFRCATNLRSKIPFDSRKLVLLEDSNATAYITKPIVGIYDIFIIQVDRVNIQKLMDILKDYGILGGIKFSLYDCYGYIRHKIPEVDYLLHKKKEQLLNNYDNYLQTLLKNSKFNEDDYIESYYQDNSIKLRDFLNQNSYSYYVNTLEFIEEDGKNFAILHESIVEKYKL